MDPTNEEAASQPAATPAPEAGDINYPGIRGRGRGRRAIFSDEEADDIARLYRLGNSVTTIAKRYHTNNDRIRMILSGTKPEPPPPRSPAPAERPTARPAGPRTVRNGEHFICAEPPEPKHKDLNKIVAKKTSAGSGFDGMKRSEVMDLFLDKFEAFRAGCDDADVIAQIRAAAKYLKGIKAISPYKYTKTLRELRTPRHPQDGSTDSCVGGLGQPSGSTHHRLDPTGTGAPQIEARGTRGSNALDEALVSAHISAGPLPASAPTPQDPGTQLPAGDGQQDPGHQPTVAEQIMTMLAGARR